MPEFIGKTPRAADPYEVKRNMRRPRLLGYSKVIRVLAWLVLAGSIISLFSGSVFGVAACISGLVSSAGLFALAELIIMFIDIEINQLEQTRLLGAMAEGTKPTETPE